MKFLWKLWLHPIEDDWVKLIKSSYEKIQNKLSLFLLSIILIFFTLLVVWWRIENLPIPGYRLWSENKPGDVARTFPLPALTTSKVRKWSVRAVKDTFSFNFVNYEEKMNIASSYFTDEGWSAIKSEISRRKIIENIVDNQLAVVLTPTDQPTIVSSFTYMNNSYWRIEMPILLVYKGAKKNYTEKAIFNILVAQVNTMDNAEGLAIQSIKRHGR
jgi:hypothetical protein